MKHFRDIVLFLSMIIPGAASLAQSVKPNSGPENYKPVVAIENQDGWIVPGLEKAHVIRALTERSKHGNPQLDFDVLLLKPDAEVHVELSTYWYVESKQTLRAYEHDYSVDSILRYGFKGQVFCYLVWVNEHIHSDDGGRVVGPIIGFRYYDTNGDGRFRLQKRGGDVLDFVADWVMKRVDQGKNSRIEASNR